MTSRFLMRAFTFVKLSSVTCVREVSLVVNSAFTVLKNATLQFVRFSWTRSKMLFLVQWRYLVRLWCIFRIHVVQHVWRAMKGFGIVTRDTVRMWWSRIRHYYWPTVKNRLIICFALLKSAAAVCRNFVSSRWIAAKALLTAGLNRVKSRILSAYYTAKAVGIAARNILQTCKNHIKLVILAIKTKAIIVLSTVKQRVQHSSSKLKQKAGSELMYFWIKGKELRSRFVWRWRSIVETFKLLKQQAKELVQQTRLRTKMVWEDRKLKWKQSVLRLKLKWNMLRQEMQVLIKRMKERIHFLVTRLKSKKE